MNGLSLETKEEEAARLGQLASSEILSTELSGDEKYMINSETHNVKPVAVETLGKGDQELSTLEEIKEKITELRKSLLPLTEEENDIIEKRQYEWYKTEEGKQALQKAYKENLDSTDLFLKEKHPDLFKKIEEYRIVAAEIRGWRQQEQDIETTNLASNPRIIDLINMSDNDALDYIKAIRSHGMGDYHGFQISSKDYIAATKVILANPKMSEDEKLKKIAILYSLIGGYQHEYSDQFKHLTRLSEEQEEKMKEIARKFGRS